LVPTTDCLLVEAGVQEVPALPPHLNSERILIVEDEAPLREVFKEILTLAGFQSEALEGVEEALYYLRRNDCHLILTDIRLPGLDGFDLLRHVGECCPETAVIMITGIHDIQVAVNSLAAGAYDYITKPFLAQELAAKVARALERRRLMVERHQYHTQLELRVREQTAHLEQALGQVEHTYSHTLEALTLALDARERETQKHSQRVSHYTVAIAERLGISGERLVDIRRGSLLHDIGKIGVPDRILLKPKKLTECEWVEVRKHPEIGYNILREIAFLEGATQMVLQHHERFDGKGYPQGLCGQNILLGARIFAVVDTYDAMTSDRPYRKALGYKKAQEEIIRCAGSQFDPCVVEAFLSIPEEVWTKTTE